MAALHLILPQLAQHGEASSRHVMPQLHPSLLREHNLPPRCSIAQLHCAREAWAAEDPVLGQRVHPAHTAGQRATGIAAASRPPV